MPAGAHPSLACGDDDLVVHLQSDECGPPHSRQPEKLGPAVLLGKMFRPDLLPGMKQRHGLARQWVYCICARTFALVAAATGKTEVGKGALPTLALWHNVIGNHSLAGVCLKGLAISATMIVRFF